MEIIKASLLSALQQSGGGGGSIAPKPDIITENGTYLAATDNLDGYSSVEVNVPQSGGGLLDKIAALPTIASVSITGNWRFEIKHGNPLKEASQTLDSSRYYDAEAGAYAFVAWVRNYAEFNYIFMCLYNGSTLVYAHQAESQTKKNAAYMYDGSISPDMTIYMTTSTDLTGLTISNASVRRSTTVGNPNCQLDFTANYSLKYRQYAVDGTITREVDYTQSSSYAAKPFEYSQYDKIYAKDDSYLFAKQCEAFYAEECGGVVEHL